MAIRVHRGCGGSSGIERGGCAGGNPPRVSLVRLPSKTPPRGHAGLPAQCHFRTNAPQGSRGVSGRPSGMSGCTTASPIALSVAPAFRAFAIALSRPTPRAISCCNLGITVLSTRVRSFVRAAALARASFSWRMYEGYVSVAPLRRCNRPSTAPRLVPGSAHHIGIGCDPASALLRGEFPAAPVTRRTDATLLSLANDGQDTRAIQHYLGHRSIASTVRYTALAPDRFKHFWKD
jgi:hypothetical protein